MGRLLLVVAAAGLGAADAAALDPATRAAVDRGVAYLRGRYAGGQAAPGVGVGGVNHGLGEAALAGLALLEGGAPAGDPAVQAIAAGVRQACLPDTQTYHVALCVLFLDRLGEPADRPLIQVLGVKLYAGLLRSGGYTYNCGEALNAGLLASLQDSQLDSKPAPKAKGKRPADDGFAPPPARKPAEPAPTGLHPVADQYFKAVQARIRGSGGRQDGSGDNSNTQFGLIGLWVAARNGLPADDAFGLIESRFLSSQNANAGWGYNPGAESTPAMTCAGLLGLAVGAGRRSTTPPDRRRPPAGDGGGFAPAPKPKADDGPALDGVRNKRAVQAALAALGTVVRTSLGGRGLDNFVGLGNAYYLLWSVERVCMAYNVQALGDADWYAWGRDFLLPAQLADGSWPAAGLCSQDVDTCFAVLFLVKSNLTTDLASKLGAPPDRTLRAGGSDPPPMFAPRKDPPPKDAGPAPTGDPLADGLVAATDADFPAKLTALRDGKGAEYLAALDKAIPRLAGDRRAKARAALAERFGRMTANTLRGMLQRGSEEMKQAAATAAAAKGDKSLLPELVNALADPADPVVQGARAALKGLTGQDHGPPAGADAAARTKAQTAWRAALK